MTPPAKQKPPEGNTERVEDAAEEAAEQAATPAEARRDAARAARRSADQQGLNLSDEDVQRIATATATELDARGAFDPPPAAATAQPADTAVEPQEQAPPAEPPRKKTWAERFVGR